jgi:hypothetical protein
VKQQTERLFILASQVISASCLIPENAACDMSGIDTGG